MWQSVQWSYTIRVCEQFQDERDLTNVTSWANKATYSTTAQHLQVQVQAKDWVWAGRLTADVGVVSHSSTADAVVRLGGNFAGTTRPMPRQNMWLQSAGLCKATFLARITANMRTDSAILGSNQNVSYRKQIVRPRVELTLWQVIILEWWDTRQWKNFDDWFLKKIFWVFEKRQTQKRTKLLCQYLASHTDEPQRSKFEIRIAQYVKELVGLRRLTGVGRRLEAHD